MNSKGALRKILSNLHPNTILIPNLDSNTIPTLSLLLSLHLTVTLTIALTLALALTLG